MLPVVRTPAWYHTGMEHLHIGINGFFWDKPTVGVGQYLHGLVNALALLPGITISVYVPGDTQPPPAPTGVTIVRLRVPFSGRSRQLAKLAFEQYAVPIAAQLDRVDLLHVPYFAPPLASRAPVVCTIPDLIPLTRAAYRGGALVRGYTALVRQAALRARRLIAISAYVKDTIVTVLPRPAADIDVTLLAADPMYMPDGADSAVRTRYQLPDQFVYYVGGYDERKNLATLIAAYAALPIELRQRVPLVLAGQAAGTNPALFPDIDALIQQHNLGATVRRIDVPRADNPALYRAATLFVYPSCDEGFGLPPLEAMASGTAVICADTASMPEVVGSAARLVPPFDQAAWTRAMHELLTDEPARTAYQSAGIARARAFSYTKTAAATLRCYQRALGRAETV